MAAIAIYHNEIKLPQRVEIISFGQLHDSLHERVRLLLIHVASDCPEPLRD